MLKSSQIGGKGTIRRKKKRIGHNFNNKMTEEARLYIKKVNDINKMILLINDEEYNIFKIYLDNELEDLGLAIEKDDLRKESRKKINEIKDDSFSYICSLLIKNIDKPIEFNNDKNNYNNIKKIFEPEFLEIIIKFLYELENNLEKKMYIKKNTDIKKNIDIKTDL